ncbi:MAG: hypothetical protein LBM38_01600 [Clostridiales bacterium]|jgi:hypothetical protein|nr:hypothetical protein [Clostridiales bacterium]
MFEVGQLLWLKFRFNNSGDVSNVKHPYVIANIDEQNKTIEIIQLDSIDFNKNAFWAFKKCSCIIDVDNPKETVITKDSFAQLNNRFTIDLYDELNKYRRTKNKLSDDKLHHLLKKYKEYHDNNTVEDNKIVHISKEELENLNNI